MRSSPDPCTVEHDTQSRPSTSILQRIWRGVQRVLPPPSTNYTSKRIKPSPYDLLGQRPTIIDIGALDAQGHYVFGSPPPGSQLITVDIEQRPGIDIIADAHDLSVIPDHSVDCALCVSVLNYCHTPTLVLAEINRILKPGGIVYISVPFLYHFDSYSPSDYYRFTVRGLGLLCTNFEPIATGWNRGPASTFHDLFVHFAATLFSFNSQKLYSLAMYVLRWLFFWIKYLDVWLSRYDRVVNIYTGVYYLGRKPH